MRIAKQPTVNLLTQLRWLKSSLFFHLQLESTLWLWTLPAWLPILCFLVQMTAKEQLSWLAQPLLAVYSLWFHCGWNQKCVHKIVFSTHSCGHNKTHYEPGRIMNKTQCIVRFILLSRTEWGSADSYTAFWYQPNCPAPTLKSSKESLQFSTAFSISKHESSNFFCFVLMVFFIVFIKSGRVLEMRVSISFRFK